MYVLLACCARASYEEVLDRFGTVSISLVGSITATGVGSGAGADALLLETGDFLLLETGDFLLLE